MEIQTEQIQRLLGFILSAYESGAIFSEDDFALMITDFLEYENTWQQPMNYTEFYKRYVAVF